MQQKSCPSSVKPTDTAILAQVTKLASPYKGKEDMLIQVLKKVQTVVGHSSISKDVAIVVAEAMDIPLINVYEVASFYSMFATTPRGKNVIRVCKSAPCHVKGAAEVMEAISKALGVQFGETTPDEKFTLETCECLGICAVSPAMMINDDVYGELTPEKAVEIIKNY